MQLTKNEIEILKVLLSASDFISSYDIATATGINRRIVRDEMINIKIILKENGYHLLSKTSKGYMIEGKSTSSLSYLQKIIEQAERQRESVFPILPWERENYIMKRLIEANDYIKIDDLSVPYVADKLLEDKKKIENELLTLFGLNNVADKKERLIVDEANANNDYINRNVDLLYKNRKIACDKINEKFNRNISVKRVNNIEEEIYSEGGEINE